MKTALRALALLTLVTAAGCSTLRVGADFDSAFAFDRVQSYSWAKSKDGDAASKYAFLDRRIRRAVDAELAAKGYARRDSGGDVLVVYTAKVQQRADIYTHGYRWNRYRSVDYYKEGTLVLGMVDRKTDEIVWTGWAEGIVSDTGQSEEEIRRAVTKLLKTFPPQ